MKRNRIRVVHFNGKHYTIEIYRNWFFSWVPLVQAWGDHNPGKVKPQMLHILDTDFDALVKLADTFSDPAELSKFQAAELEKFASLEALYKKEIEPQVNTSRTYYS